MASASRIGIIGGAAIAVLAGLWIGAAAISSRQTEPALTALMNKPLYKAGAWSLTNLHHQAGMISSSGSFDITLSSPALNQGQGPATLATLDYQISHLPTPFSLNGNPSTWGTNAPDYTQMAASLQQILGWLPTQGVVIGEWGSISMDVLSSRVAHAAAYAQDVTKSGMCPIWWDDGGGFALLDRTKSPPSWKYPAIASAIITGAMAGEAPGATYAPYP